MSTQIQLRRDTAADWTSNDPTLAEGEIGWESDTNLFKIGDGSTAWTSLEYALGSNLIHISGTFPDTAAQGDFGAPIRVPEDGTLVEVTIWCDTAPTNAALILDCNKGGTTVFTTQSGRPQIATSSTYDVSGTPDVTALSKGDVLQLEIDQYNVSDDVEQIYYWISYLAG